MFAGNVSGEVMYINIDVYGSLIAMACNAAGVGERYGGSKSSSDMYSRVCGKWLLLGRPF